jgi:hypothetical protein
MGGFLCLVHHNSGRVLETISRHKLGGGGKFMGFKVPSTYTTNFLLSAFRPFSYGSSPRSKRTTTTTKVWVMPKDLVC